MSLEVVPLDRDTVGDRVPVGHVERPSRTNAARDQLERGRAVGGRAGGDIDVRALDEWQPPEHGIWLAQIGLAVAVSVEREERVDLLADRAQTRNAYVGAIDEELVVLAPLIAPQLLVPDVHGGHAAGAVAGVLFDRYRLEQPESEVAPHERLVIDVQRWQRRPHERELVARVRLDRNRSPGTATCRAVGDRQ